MALTAVLLDSLGTLLRMEPPAPRLRKSLARLGFDVPPDAAESAVRAEISYYLEHHMEGRDASSLADLRNRCAAVVLDQLALPGLSLEAVRPVLLESLHFEAFPDTAPSLAQLRERGLRLVVASNWDCSLREVLRARGIEPLVDEVVTSAEVGARKPDAALFRAALEAAGTDANDAVHVGDSPENDVAGAEAAGIRPVLVDRAGGRRDLDAVPVIATLEELPALLT
ncbi:MAG: HAD-IA family hydrolase [Actinobacteria bacterium]|nr:HAD-IA family hydrolase [Actinomycetota bacterium]